MEKLVGSVGLPVHTNNVRYFISKEKRKMGGPEIVACINISLSVDTQFEFLIFFGYFTRR